MRLVAAGRDADVYEISPDRVLRRYRDPTRSAVGEAEVMRHALHHGVPVPDVIDTEGPDLVMQRLTGPTMAQFVMRRPWTVTAEARRLADIHRSVHDVSAPEGLRQVGEGTALLHLDLHPENVILSPDGPYVIDWSNAASGPAAADVADVWLIMSAVRVQGALPRRVLGERLARRFAQVFAAASGVDYESQLATAAERRLSDKNVTAAERDRIRALLPGR